MGAYCLTCPLAALFNLASRCPLIPNSHELDVAASSVGARGLVGVGNSGTQSALAPGHKCVPVVCVYMANQLDTIFSNMCLGLGFPKINT